MAGILNSSPDPVLGGPHPGRAPVLGTGVLEGLLTGVSRTLVFIMSGRRQKARALPTLGPSPGSPLQAQGSGDPSSRPSSHGLR